MTEMTGSALDELVRAGSLLTKELQFKNIIVVFVEQAVDITRSDLACLYLNHKPDEMPEELKLCYQRGRYMVPTRLSCDDEWIEFLIECQESILLLEKKHSPFRKILLHEDMQSGIALPLFAKSILVGILILNARSSDFYNRKKFHFLDSFSKFAGGILHNALLYNDLKEYLKEIENLRLYQENIFSSMTNLLITTDKNGNIQYFNQAAQDTFDIDENQIGKTFSDVFQSSIDNKIMKTIDSRRENHEEQLGIEGIYHSDKDIDFSLNISPLKGKRGENQGITLLFTDQSRERALQDQMEQVVEDKRIIKDMFSRYLSADVVKQLMEAPNLVKPGGDKKEATILFADIRGYTPFSEGKDPEYIIDVLNAFFSKAVEAVIKHQGYIDKFIGDCIMAAWGVPLWTEQEDAIHAVSCALEIQKLVDSKERSFFTGRASDLKIGIGMHTGSLIAGNLGSTRKMNYTVIGDTVNIAARLEGIAGPGEIIITEKTRDYLGDLFVFEKRKPVLVQGKKEPIPIYNVIGKS